MAKGKLVYVVLQRFSKLVIYHLTTREFLTTYCGGVLNIVGLRYDVQHCHKQATDQKYDVPANSRQKQ